MTSRSRVTDVGDIHAPSNGQGDPSKHNLPGGGSPRLSLEEKTAQLKVRRRDCRTCRAFRQDESGMSFGWCTAFEQYVKLYHPAGEFWSQCQFKVIARTPCSEAPPATHAAVGRPSPARPPVWVPVPATD